MILSYESFLNESNDYMLFQLSDKFIEYLEAIDHPISKRILSLHSKECKENINFIDITDSMGYVSIIQSNRVMRKYLDYVDDGGGLSKKEWSEMMGADETADIWNSQRTVVLIGRFVGTIFGSEFNNMHVESFVNMYKATQMIKENELQYFELVKGEDIRKYYREETYEIMCGQLGNSCMRYKRCQQYFDIYVENPSVCELLILKSKSVPGNIRGRALVWTTTTGEKVIDRIYMITDHEIYLVKEWMDLNSVRHINGYDVIQLDKWDFTHYPYLDNFKYLNNDGTLTPYKGRDILFELTDMHGGTN